MKTDGQTTFVGRKLYIWGFFHSFYAYFFYYLQFDCDVLLQL